MTLFDPLYGRYAVVAAEESARTHRKGKNFSKFRLRGVENLDEA